MYAMNCVNLADTCNLLTRLGSYSTSVS